MLIPGTSASMIDAVNKKNGKTCRAWIGNQKYINNGYKFLMCHYSKEQQKVINFCDRFYDLKIVQGDNGCKSMISLGNRLFLGKYFYNLIEWFKQSEKDYVCFTYDWRQCIRNIAVQFREFLEKYSDRKVILIAHSLGNIVVETYFRMYSDYGNQIVKYIALAPPYNGTGFATPQMLLTGYDMNSPLPTSICKQIQLGGACLCEMSGNNSSGIWVKEGINQVIPKAEEFVDWEKVKLNEINYYSLPYEIIYLMKKENYKLFLSEFILMQSFCKKGLVELEGYQQKKQRDLFLYLEQQNYPIDKNQKQNCDDYQLKKWNSQELVYLSQLMYPSGTILGFLYQVDIDMKQYIDEIKSKEIIADERVQIYIISGYGVLSYGDIYINDVVNDYREIGRMKQSKVQQQGDGTVLLKSTFCYPFPESMIKEHYIKKNCDHTKMLNSEWIIWKIENWLNN